MLSDVFEGTTKTEINDNQSQVTTLHTFSNNSLTRTSTSSRSFGSKRRSCKTRVLPSSSDMLLRASTSKHMKDVAAHRQVVFTLCGAALFFIGSIIMTIAFVATLLHTRDALYREGLEIRRRSAEGVTQEMARVLQPVYVVTRRLSEQARLGVAMGSRTWPPSRETFETRYSALIANLWIQMESGTHFHKASGEWQENYPSLGLWARMAVRKDLQTPATSMEECAHVLEVLVLEDSSIVPRASQGKVVVEADPEYKLALHSFISTDADGTPGPKTELHIFDTRTRQLLPSVLDEVDGTTCEQMKVLWESTPMLEAFGNFSWHGPLLEQQKAFYGSAPLYTQDGQRQIGFFGAIVSLQESLSRVLIAIQKEGGHFSQGAEVAIVTGGGLLLGATASGGDGWGDPAARAAHTHVSELPDDSLLKQAISDISRKAQSACPSHHLFLDEEDRLVDAMPFHAEDYGLAPLNGRWCVIHTFPRENMYEALDAVQKLRFVTGGLNIVIFASAILLFIASLFLALTSGRGVKADKLRADLRKVQSAVKDVESLNSPMVLVSANVFLKLQRLEPFETLRDQGVLRVLDSLEDVIRFKQESTILFFSHQWLSIKYPDTLDGVQLAAMKGAIRTVYSDPAMHKEVYVWCDFTSIAQRHGKMQQAAIASLPVYASVADKFIIIAPPATHEDFHCECNLETYNQRGWCRAEMLATACGNGIREMYICADTAGTLAPIFAEDLANLSLNIFEGKFTVPEDAENLVKPALGLYALVLRDKKLPHMEAIHAHIQEDKKRFFPKNYYNSNRGEQVELFGSCVGALEAFVEEANDYWTGGSFSRQ